MNLALEEAKKCKKDVPIGCIIEKDGEIIAYAHNMRESINDITAHAEMIAIKEAQKKLNTSHLNGCNMYVTLEPCPMCSWAILQSGIDTLYFGAYNTQYGGIESALNLPKLANSKIKTYGGIAENECKILLDKFFEEIRK
ncbi:MAG: nucleoside deaminase [bacterium]|nr:nucleoside deaminase [bacterium]